MSERIDLEAFKYATMRVLPKEMVVEFSQDQMGSFIRDTMAVVLTRKVYGHRLAEWDLQVEVPKNWWQHLKRTVGLHAKTVTHTGHVTRKRIYPDLPLVPNHGVGYVVEDE